MDELFLPLHNDLVHELQQAGFNPKPGTDLDIYIGTVRNDRRSWDVELALQPPYPEGPPKVWLSGPRGPRGWHEELDGSMCLYPNSPSTSFPWLARGDLRQSMLGWCKQNEDGWRGDTPDLDLHRYWFPSSRFDLVIHGSLDEHCAHWVALDRVPGTKTLRARGTLPPPRKRPKSHPHRYAMVRDIGELALPVTSWDSLRGHIPDPDVLMKEVLARRATIILLRYSRNGHVGSLAVEPWLMAAKKGSGEQGGLRVAWAAIETAIDGPAVSDLRRGPYLSKLRAKKVAVVGVGGIGSFVAQGLHRVGVGRLTLVDFEPLRPGNMARHAADPSHVGLKKADAMAKTLADGNQEVVPRVARLRSREDARGLTETHDVVVDATGSETITQLLLLATSASPVVCAYLKNQGRSKVVEVLHKIGDTRAVPIPMEPIGVDGYESGCGDPVSPTPLHAVEEAAAMATRIVVELLLGHEAATELRETP